LRIGNYEKHKITILRMFTSEQEAYECLHSFHSQFSIKFLTPPPPPLHVTRYIAGSYARCLNPDSPDLPIFPIIQHSIFQNGETL